jgi:transcriptional regulator with XRE-family HTH domain
MSRSTPTLRRRYLSAELKRLRIEAGISAGQAADALGCSTDKIHWIERAGWSHPKWRDVRDLLDAYGVAANPKRDELITLARESGGKDWWQPYSRMLSKKYTAFIGLEADAASVLTFELCMVPGLLQTEDYARAAIEAAAAGLTAEEIDQRVAVRMERQRIFHEGDSRRLYAVVDEAALRRPVGGPNVMRAQIEHLIDLAGHPKITLRVVPFSAGPHPSATGAFTLLSFSEGSPMAVYAETVGGDVLVEDPLEIAGYERVFRRLGAMALTPEGTVTALTTIGG